MIIGFNLWNLKKGAGGVNHYTLTLIRNWHDFYPDDQLVLFCFKHNWPILDEINKRENLEFRLIENQEKIEMDGHYKTIDVYFCPFQCYYPRPLPLPTVVTCHDIQERFFPDYFGPDDIKGRRYHYDWSMRMADSVVAISDFTKQSCNKILGTPKRKIVTVHHAPDTLPRPEQPKNWPFKGYVDYVYFPGNDWNHKNHDRVIELANKIASEKLDIKIVLSGDQLRGWNWWSEQIAKKGLGNTLVHLGRVTREQVAWLYQNALGLFFPSQFEGFGIPVIEAMSLGCPVACSSLGVLREVAQDDALYFHPHEVDSMLAALIELKDNESLRGILSARGKARAATFTYEKLIRGHHEAMELAQKRFTPRRHWIKQKILFPYSEKYLATEIPKRQIRIAKKLIAPDGTFRSNHRYIEQQPSLQGPTSNPRDLASVFPGLEYLPFDTLPAIDGRVDLLKRQMGTGVAAALYILNYLHKSLHLEGDICEFGVAAGASTALIANDLIATDSNKHIWLFDTFAGLPAPTEEDVLIDDIFQFGSMEAYEGEMSYQEHEVLSRLKAVKYPVDQCHLIKGMVEDTLRRRDLPKEIAFANIDLDFYSGVLHALEYLHKVLAPTGYVVVDDYNFFSLGAKIAVDEFLCKYPGQYEFHLPQAQFGAFCILRKIDG